MPKQTGAAKNQGGLIISISAFSKIIDIFLGPFLVAYFIKTSADSFVDLSIYNILWPAFSIIFIFIVGFFMSKNHTLAMFRIGVISQFIYVLAIIVLQAEIVNNIEIISLLLGFSLMTFYLPFNEYTARAIGNRERASFEVKRKAVSTVLAILVPICMGAAITTTDYVFTASIIAIISAAQIIMSFFLQDLPKNNDPFNPIKAWRKFKKNPQIKNLLIADFFNGLTINSGALGVLITILIVNSFKTDFMLGTITSIASVVALLACYIYSKSFKGKSDKVVIVISSLMPIIGILLFFLFSTDASVVAATVIFEVFALGLLSLILNIRLFNLISVAVNKGYRTEYWCIREVALATGRIVSFALMLAVGIMGIAYLNYLLILLCMLIPVVGYFASKIDKNEDPEIDHVEKTLPIR